MALVCFVNCILWVLALRYDNWAGVTAPLAPQALETGDIGKRGRKYLQEILKPQVKVAQAGDRSVPKMV